MARTRVKSNSAKSLAFDSAFYTYSLGLAAYLTLYLLHAIGLSDLNPVQELAIKEMIPLSAVTALLLVATATFTIIVKNRMTTMGSILFQGKSAPPMLRSLWGLHALITFALTLTVGLLMTDFSLRELSDPDGLAGAARLFSGLAHANLALLPVAIVQVIETIFIAFLATAIAVPIAFALSFASAKNIMTGPAAFTLYALLRTTLNVVRSVEPLIWALIFTVWVGVGPFAGMLALMLHTVASLTKQFSEIVEDAAPGPIDGIRATGAGTIQTIWFGIVPQVLLPFISLTIYRWDSNVRMATVIGLVGGGGIGTLLIKYQGQAMWPEVGCIILVIAVTVWLMDVASAYIREALR